MCPCLRSRVRIVNSVWSDNKVNISFTSTRRLLLLSSSSYTQSVKMNLLFLKVWREFELITRGRLQERSALDWCVQLQRPLDSINTQRDLSTSMEIFQVFEKGGERGGGFLWYVREKRERERGGGGTHESIPFFLTNWQQMKKKKRKNR